MTNLKALTEDQEDDKLLQSYASYQFLKAIKDTWKTPDWQNFFIFQYNSLTRNHDMHGVITFDNRPDPQLPEELSRKNIIHITQIGISNEMRGCGYLEYVCSRIINLAEEYGIFVHAHAQPFKYDVPLFHTHEEACQWIDELEEGKHTDSYKQNWRTERKSCRSLYRKYLEYGFCKYDYNGYRFGSNARGRFRRSCGFGYLSSKADPRIKEHIQHQLHC